MSGAVLAAAKSAEPSKRTTPSQTDASANRFRVIRCQHTLRGAGRHAETARADCPIEAAS